MALEYKLDKIDDLDENVQKLYVKQDDGTFRLDVNGAEDVTGLKSALEHERENRRQATQAAKDAEEEAKKKAEEKLLADGNHKELYDSAMTKLDEANTTIATMKNATATEKRNSEATKIAATLAEGSNVEILSDIISRRLKYTDEGLKVLSDSGELTVSTLDELKTQIQTGGKYDSLLKGNGSGGGGANGDKDGGGAATVKNNPWKKDTLNLTQQAHIKKTDPTLAAQLEKAATSG